MAVLDSALATFARFGYRKTSMEDVARAAHISRPGLYFLFASKEDLFRAAVGQALEQDIAEVERILGESDRSLRDRLLDSFDRWAGRYIGPMTRDVAAVIEGNPDLLGTIVETAPRRFEELITDAIAVESGGEAAAKVAQTMISASIGIKHQAGSRELYLERLEVALDLLVP
ncbi:TetR/AcrR family transcriptional regulator [Nocardia miyunensis]|uniref:TetR/AcrR family transcriptional regulator n=1 Tax=Nocardia miyunensis TaxID=282684 RepID=UPI001C3F6923|nr:TetR/AcrR family transcriptional regulator [Nocardia miyunensis]